MANTVKIQDTLNWVAGMIVQRPTVGVAAPLEPALTSANKIMQMILAPPFRWSWNRFENSSIVCTPGVSDYVVSLPTWGWLEKAYLFLGGNTPPSVEIEVAQVLSKETVPNRPATIAAIFDDNAGNITFRLMPPPDQAYQVTLEGQKAAIQATALGNTTWAPIPDRYAFLYEQGMLATLQGIYSGQLYAMNMEMFLRMLISCAEGLTETEKAIWLEDQLRSLRTMQNSGLAVNQGKQARF
jgi:hypothetical protein